MSFFFDRYEKNYIYIPPTPKGLGMLCVMLSVQKNEKTTRTVLILESNSISFSVNFFSMIDIIIFNRGGG